MATTRRTGLALLLASGLAAATLPLAVSTAASAGTPPAGTTASASTASTASTVSAQAPLAKKKKKKKKKAAKLTLSTTTIKKGQKVKVKGKKFPKKKTYLALSVCKVPVGSMNCNHAPNAIKAWNYNGKGKFSKKFKFKKNTIKFKTEAGKINCKKVQCVLGTVNMYAFTDRTWQATTPFRVA